MSANAQSHDAAGNLTYDGTQKYTYDAWNRLTQVAHAYRDSGGSLQTTGEWARMTYDGLGRRIEKAQRKPSADNVLGIVDSGGLLVERYEYTPYGERKVFFSAGTSDPGCYNPTRVRYLIPRSFVVNKLSKANPAFSMFSRAPSRRSTTATIRSIFAPMSESVFAASST